jgi:hypothetical protein
LDLIRNPPLKATIFIKSCLFYVKVNFRTLGIFEDAEKSIFFYEGEIF